MKEEIPNIIEYKGHMYLRCKVEKIQSNQIKEHEWKSRSRKTSKMAQD